jgi:bifunctional UDP-N-acetylglucosamine pyrophosphorylase/glucosamine-1-phosphate N-acetyltransferase
MTDPRLAAVVMAAGLGTRMRSGVPKHVHSLLGRRVVDWVLVTAQELQPKKTIVVVAPGSDDEFKGVELAVQAEPRGTADAVASARAALDGFGGDVLVLDGAAPLLTTDILQSLLDKHRREAAAVTVLSFEPEGTLPYGRIVRNGDGALQAIVEERDATPEQLAIRELNSSIYVFEAQALWSALGLVRPDNDQSELYLTDTVEHIVAAGKKGAVYRSPDPVAPIGVNTRTELAHAGAVLRDRVNEAHMLAGVTIVDPSTTWIDASVELEPDVVIHPFTVLRGATRAARGAEIGSHTVVVDAVIGSRATLGPFCYVRPGTVLEDEAKAGTFVEVKNSRIGARAKVPHLSYIGDADVGEGTNVAAGNITANFSHQAGIPKGRTTIGRNVRTGVDNTFKAPVTVGDDAWIFPGTVITEDVPPGSLAGFPPRQVTKEGWVYERGSADD